MNKIFSILEKFDEYLLSKFQSIADWLGKEYGVSPYKISFNIYMIMCILFILVASIFFQDGYIIYAITLLFSMLFIFAVAYDVYELIKKMTESTANPFKLKYMLTRYFCIILMPQNTITSLFFTECKNFHEEFLVDLSIVINIIAIIALYLSCVEFPPPQKKKISVKFAVALPNQT